MMTATARSASLDRVELNRLLQLYDLECYLFKMVSPRFRDEETLTPYDFFTIVIWKSNRAKRKVKEGLAAARKTVASLMQEVNEAESPEAKVETLLQVRGIGLAMASAILTVCYPEQFTVLDHRAWTTLKAASVGGLPARYPQAPEEFLRYCQACRRLARQVGLSVRDLDRALWAKSWEDDLLDLING